MDKCIQQTTLEYAEVDNSEKASQEDNMRIPGYEYPSVGNEVTQVSIQYSRLAVLTPTQLCSYGYTYSIHAYACALNCN